MTVIAGDSWFVFYTDLKKNEKGREKEKEKEKEKEIEIEKDDKKKEEAVIVTDLEKEREKIREKERGREKKERDSLVGRSRAVSNLNAFDLKQERARRQQQNEEKDLKAFNIKRLELEKVLHCAVPACMHRSPLFTLRAV